MAEPMDIPAWCEANLKLPAGADEGLHLTALQRRIADAMEEPGVRVRFLTPSELHRLAAPRRLAELLVLLEMTGATGDVLIYERTEGDDV